MAATEAVWQHKTSKSDSHWHDFEAAISARVEELYKAKSASAAFLVEGRPYTIKFADMKQYSDTDSTRVRLVRRVEAPASRKRPHPEIEPSESSEPMAATSTESAAGSHGKGSPDKVRRVEPTSLAMPTVTVYTLGGNAAWGPRKVTPELTVADIALDLDRPAHSPGLKLFNGEAVLSASSRLSTLSDPTDLRVQFDPPKLFDHSFVKALSDLTDERVYFDGDVLEPGSLVIPHAEVVRLEVQKISAESIWDFNVRLRLKAASPLIASKTDKVLTFSEELRKIKLKDAHETLDGKVVSVWPVSAQIVQHSGEDLIADAQISSEFDEDSACDLCLTVIDGPVEQLYSRNLDKIIHEGISYQTGIVSEELTLKLNKSIDVLKATTAADYHPGSNSIVRDLVHPSLFPFVKGTSPTGDLSDVTPVGHGEKDKWGRPYETSKYQWLPSEVSVAKDGKCHFDTYINNLDREKHSALYSALEELLRHALPHLESSWAHGWAVPPPDEGDDDDSDVSQGEPAALEDKSLRGRTIQVITKIVDYEVPPRGTHEGVWHVEGMSHENIVATAELILSKDDALSGGNLQFQRSFTSGEAGFLVMNLPQVRPNSVDAIIDKGLVPLGRLPLPCGRLASWPNSHIHRVTPLRNDSDTTAIRRIVVFWLINPDLRIVSTKHVAPQQSKMSLEEAHRHRLALMEERKHHKQNWNLREVTLCEH